MGLGRLGTTTVSTERNLVWPNKVRRVDGGGIIAISVKNCEHLPASYTTVVASNDLLNNRTDRSEMIIQSHVLLVWSIQRAWNDSVHTSVNQSNCPEGALREYTREPPNKG